MSTLRAVLDAQRAAFGRGAPNYARRMEALAALRDGIQAREADLIGAIFEDFGGRAREETLLLELFPLYDQIRHARRHLRGWMRRRRVPSSWFLQPARAFYQYQPLGVVGVIGAWNYPILLTLGPLVDTLAAGNHAMLKPSEVTPRSAEVIASIVSASFSPDYVACVTGGSEVASEFSSLLFDHLLFTGSTRVGKMVMAAAAQNLTPVTLELGGKSPAIIHESYPLDRAVERLMTGKLYNAGQTCVAPDYALLPEGRENAFEQEVHRVVAQLYPRLVDNADYSRVVSSQHYDRLTALLDDAVAKGARVVTVNPAREQTDRESRVFPPTLVFGAGPDAAVMQEEIFGPILPVLPYRTLADAIASVNARPRPLALYYFDDKSARVDRVLAETTSGGVTVNDCVYHLAQHNLPFGGAGQSGMGHYHGLDGFQTFSKKKGVMVQRRWSATGLLRPPYASKQRLIWLLLRLARRGS